MTTANVLHLVKEFVAQTESRFASIVYTTQMKKTSKYLLHLNVNMMRVMKNDLAMLKRIDRTKLSEVEAVALAEVIASAEESIATNFNNSAYTKKDYYTYLAKGVKFNEEVQLYFNAYVVSETVLIPGEEKKPVKSADKTIAKNKFRRMMKQSKFREFKFDMNAITTLKINGKTLEIA